MWISLRGQKGKERTEDPEKTERKGVHKSDHQCLKKNWKDPQESGKDWKQMWGELNKALTEDEVLGTQHPVKGTL